jgi:hypothetical protein
MEFSFSPNTSISMPMIHSANYFTTSSIILIIIYHPGTGTIGKYMAALIVDFVPPQSKNRGSPSAHQKTEAYPVSEPLRSPVLRTSDDGQNPNPVIMSVIRHRQWLLRHTAKRIPLFSGGSSLSRRTTPDRRSRPGFDAHQYKASPHRADVSKGRTIDQMYFNAPGEWGPSGLWKAATQIPGQWTQ